MSDEARALIRELALTPLPGEGGWFRETYRAAGDGSRPTSTAIYYLITPGASSALHRLPHDELFHFYAGDAAEQLLLFPDGRHELRRLGPSVFDGERPQSLVPADCWQGTRVANGGSFSLLGTTMTPGFMFDDLELADIEQLARSYPDAAELIRQI